MDVVGIPRDTSLMSSAAAWQPCTRILVQDERSRCVSTRNRCITMPWREPVLVAKVRSDPRQGGLHPECTSLQEEGSFASMGQRIWPSFSRSDCYIMGVPPLRTAEVPGLFHRQDSSLPEGTVKRSGVTDRLAGS